MHRYMNMHPYMNFYYTYPPHYVYPNMYHPFYSRYMKEQMNQMPFHNHPHQDPINLQPLNDYGKKPFTVNIEEAAEANRTYRTAIWTGEYLQVTLMSIGVGDDIGLELHPDTDQFLRIEEGEGLVQMGHTKDNLDFKRYVSEDSAIMVPAGMWHNLTNTGNQPLKLYSIYAPPEHPAGTVHKTKEEAMAAEENTHY